MQNLHQDAARRALGAEHPRYAQYIAALVGSDLTVGNRYEVLANGDQIFPAMLPAINAGRARIKFETYILQAWPDRYRVHRRTRSGSPPRRSGHCRRGWRGIGNDGA